MVEHLPSHRRPRDTAPVAEDDAAFREMLFSPMIIRDYASIRTVVNFRFGVKRFGDYASLELAVLCGNRAFV